MELNEVEQVYIFATDFSEHVQGMIHGIASYAKLRSPPWQIRWCQNFSPELASNQSIVGYIYFALDDQDRKALFDLNIPGVNLSLRNLPVPRSATLFRW